MIQMPVSSLHVGGFHPLKLTIKVYVSPPENQTMTAWINAGQYLNSCAPTPLLTQN